MKKSSWESRLVISQVMMPSQANVAGNVHGGEIIKLMDSAAYAAARRYARSNVVTARVDELEFHLPIFIGDMVIASAQVVYVGKSSMEVAVNVDVEDLEGGDRTRALSAFLPWSRWIKRAGRIWCRNCCWIRQRKKRLSQKANAAMKPIK